MLVIDLVSRIQVFAERNHVYRLFGTEYICLSVVIRDCRCNVINLLQLYKVSEVALSRRPHRCHALLSSTGNMLALAWMITPRPTDKGESYD